MIKMLTPAGFSELYDEVRRENRNISNQQCYELLEMEHQKYFNRRRYSSYDSFRKVRERSYQHDSTHTYTK